MNEEDYRPLFPKERREERSGLVVIYEQMTPEMRKDRREDNKLAKRSRGTHRKRKPHGRQVSGISKAGAEIWRGKAKQKQKEKRKSAKSQPS